MAKQDIPHFQNSKGDEKIEIGAKIFMCIGAEPPFDHPHIYLDMGVNEQTTCPYCSTTYVFNSTLSQNSAEPASAIFIPKTA